MAGTPTRQIRSTTNKKNATTSPGSSWFADDDWMVGHICDAKAFKLLRPLKRCSFEPCEEENGWIHFTGYIYPMINVRGVKVHFLRVSLLLRLHEDVGPLSALAGTNQSLSHTFVLSYSGWDSDLL
jgi:hypothetical protein